jgi:uncharacterized protein YggT (Ycf19 family)
VRYHRLRLFEAIGSGTLLSSWSSWNKKCLEQISYWIAIVNYIIRPLLGPSHTAVCDNGCGEFWVIQCQRCSTVHSYSKPKHENMIFAELTCDSHNPIHKLIQLLNMLVLSPYLAILLMHTFLQLFNGLLQFLNLNHRLHNLHSNRNRIFLAFRKTRTAARISTV